MSSVWVTKRSGKHGARHLVRWIEPETGKNRGKTFKRLEDARVYASQLLSDFAGNSYFSPVKISFDDWVRQHIEGPRNLSDLDLAPKTIAGHGEALAALKAACKPNSPLDITPKMIRQFRQTQKQNGLAARTINKHIAAIRSALSYAVRDEIVPANKLLGPHRLFLREEQKVIRVLEVGEAVALMNAATDLKHRTAISLAYYHGMRRNEICRLWWQDVDLEMNRLEMVHRQDARIKTRRSRVVALRQETADLLKRMYQNRVNKYVFTNPAKFYWSCDKWFPSLVEEAGLDHCTIQDLRKTCNTAMQDSGVSQEAAMQVLGHSTPEVNRNHYTGVLTKQQRAAVDSLPSIG